MRETLEFICLHGPQIRKSRSKLQHPRDFLSTVRTHRQLSQVPWIVESMVETSNAGKAAIWEVALNYALSSAEPATRSMRCLSCVSTCWGRLDDPRFDQILEDKYHCIGVRGDWVLYDLPSVKNLWVESEKIFPVFMIVH